jgi:hypothetical protein
MYAGKVGFNLNLIFNKSKIEKKENCKIYKMSSTFERKIQPQSNIFSKFGIYIYAGKAHFNSKVIFHQ